MIKNLGKDKLIKIGIGIIAGVVLITVILLIFHALTSKKSGYGDIENKLVNAAKKYYGDNKNLLPQAIDETISIDDQTLTSLGYLKDLNDIVDKEGVTCTGKVVITYHSNGRYRYTGLLDCGDKYQTKTLTSYIESNEPKVFTGAGLYELNGEYVYRGETPNNHIKFSGYNYRIVKITEGKAMLILDERYKKTVWDNRYNNDRGRTDGINDYGVSRIREYVDKIYDEENLIKEDDKSLLTVQKAYIGKRSETDNYNDGTIEKSEYIENQYMSVLPLYDYINASVDNNCNSGLTRSCKNYNYLNYYNFNWWTITADRANTYRVYRISNTGTIEDIRTSSKGYIRPIIYLVNDAIYVKGDGTEDNPYIVK